MASIQEISNRLAEIEREKKQLLEALVLLQKPEAPQSISDAEKIRLFLSLFRCRGSVFPKLWENSAKGIKGYSPACANEWKPGICQKPKIKCSECRHQSFLKLDEKAALEHLQGKSTIGTYAIREDDRCVFLAADFDGDGFAEDVLAYKAAALRLGLEVAIERSRSGNGAHGWIFFSEAIPARTARQLGTLIVARASTHRHMRLETYDRFFPNQDFLPKGGFGNLIALPLQYKPRQAGNTVFIDDEFRPIEDQWRFLSDFKRLSEREIQSLLETHLPGLSGLCLEADTSIVVAEKALDIVQEASKNSVCPEQIEFEICTQLAIKLENLPSHLIAAFRRVTTFANPKFFELERLRFSTWKTPRYIFCGELLDNRLILPRGALEPCLEICKQTGVKVILKDSRHSGKKNKFAFQGKLSAEQKKCIQAVLPHEYGVLVAPPGAGKTVMACAIMAKRKLPTLILVHRMPLLEQWRSQIAVFLGIDPKKVGVFAGAKRKQSNLIDIGMLQTLSNMDNLGEVLKGYGQVIIDECHHLPAVSFEAILKQCPAKFVLGLTATPYRKDGHQKIIHFQCGPVRHAMTTVDGVELTKQLIVRETSFMPPEELGPKPQIQQIWKTLVEDKGRLALMASDILQALENGRFPLVISERKQHLVLLEQAIREQNSTIKDLRVISLIGGMGKKERAGSLDAINSMAESTTKPCVLATGSLIGEGFDLPALDTLFVTMPVSFKGKLIQYAGRIHRAAAGKTRAMVYDYLDSSSALTVSMFRKRQAAYKKMGYEVSAWELL